MDGDHRLEPEKISFKNFKSLYDTSFEPGRINVFIGANGYGNQPFWKPLACQWNGGRIQSGFSIMSAWSLL